MRFLPSCLFHNYENVLYTIFLIFYINVIIYGNFRSPFDSHSYEDILYTIPLIFYMNAIVQIRYSFIGIIQHLHHYKFLMFSFSFF
ncbi:hypothetical protein GLOIN_2v1559374 [Rhizophagus irregularis DAOM 181602=DAOM 197198]|uniref:Uncharacterized protein n=1 Tax=Rhizophagus irregularis (strain DAOM 181602 / DAOM 197198 / MUCL 43194) TaxID=747089 RepID=A0A2P4QEX1_RHIID|nr:hypothetical protein GLOIN_2v1559374 [Rhizophagus irregularis DAOM 181602=DAOM 197198]POG76178.1 hypothetical protein GLOIN_2v1559374 [Rhizophagus irregularis DAOM 181602=DAOM 197198]GET57847.1 hypothetical protein GLOIN_2v1559374 [Rhizophagus irregularis DAOM 181602=DAOM 197198]|eukprot:XP_025183044.1 hypothetical protein GLOIN_2v1559374 [Rhizophagus irregularis DAOM 181602=DAOM 197198]